MADPTLMASVMQDETVGRRAVQSAINVLNRSGIKGAGASVDWDRVDFERFEKVLDEASLAVHSTLAAGYRKRGLETGARLAGMVNAVDVLLMTAVQAWLAGKSAMAISPYSQTSYTWLAVSTVMALRQVGHERTFQEAGW
jgi:hypothetical protein